MSKINVLVVPSDKTGVGKFRSVDPHVHLEKMYPDDFHVEINYQPNFFDDNYLKKFQIIHYHRTLGGYDQCELVVAKCEKLGIKTIMDLDDHWSPGPDHPAYHLIRNNNIHTKILENIKNARILTTTTPVFRDELLKHNKAKNVVVFPNAIDPTEEQYTPNPEPSDRVRIGWLGGSSHLEDLKLIDSLANKMDAAKLLDKSQLVVCGFDLRGTITTIDPNTKEQKQRDILPKESVWWKYENIFTNNHKTISKEYSDFLQQFVEADYDGIQDEAYRRVWTKHVTSYANNYNLFDVSIAPLKEHIFNGVKSQLKVIEAGFHKKALIAQNFGPYTIDIKNGENGLLVDTHKNHKQWFKHVKKLIDNPNMVSDMGEALYETVKDTYSLQKVTSDRAEFYKSLV